MNHKGKTMQTEKLQTERERLLLKLARLRETLRSEIDPVSEDGISELEERENAMGLILGVQDTLDTIEHALQRAQQGIYGFCERCGGPIDPQRLEIVPETPFCMQCKQIVERELRVATKAARY